MEQSTHKIAFFGTPDIAVWALEELADFGFAPSLVVTNPDRPQGRKMQLTPPPVKVWAQEQRIPVFQPETLTNPEHLALLTSQEWDLFVVVAYGQIMPKWVIDLPKFGTLNLHPSLLPKLRGASPIRSAILNNMQDVGVSIMLMDEKMDHGPILAQMATPLPEPVPGRKLDFTLAKQGGDLLADTIPKWIAGEITPVEQDHTQATYSKKITKEMGELTLDPHDLPRSTDAKQALLKIYALDGNPGTFFIHNNKRVKINKAHIENDTLVLDTVTPENKKEMPFSAFLQSA